jgi:hypothetical protein
MSSENMTPSTAISQSTGSESSQSSTPSTPASSATSSSTPSTTQQASQPAGNGSVGAAVQAGAQNAQAPIVPAYTPNFKFKAYEKEYEVDPLFHSLFKDTETEEKIKKLHSKAYAMEGMQEKLGMTRKEYEGYKNQVTPQLKAFEYFDKIVKAKDWDTFFTKLGVPQEEIFGWVEKQLNLAQAPADQRAEYQRNLEMRQQAYIQEEQMRTLTENYNQQATQARMMQLDGLLSRPEVTNYAANWDRVSGNIGAFRQLVIDEAAAAYYATGHDWTAEQAVQHVINKFGKVVSAGGPQAAQAMAQGQQQMAQAQPPVIPHVAGRGTSPVKKVPKSLDDLKKMAAEMDGR